MLREMTSRGPPFRSKSRDMIFPWGKNSSLVRFGHCRRLRLEGTDTQWLTCDCAGEQPCHSMPRHGFATLPCQFPTSSASVSVARRVQKRCLRRSLPLRNLVVSDEVGGVGLVTVLDHKDGRVLHPVDQRVVPSVTLARQKGTNLHTLRTLYRQANKNIYQHHLLVPR